jgi:hypothetical protein
MSSDRITPQVMIIGAQKCGTTTLYRDLMGHPDIFFPLNKEPEVLVKYPDVDDARSRYKQLYGNARPDQILAEASTAYTKMPTHSGLPKLAKRLCGPELKLIYLTRNPIERIVSQYQHDFHHHVITDNFSHAIRNDHRLIDYSRFAWQLQPWIDEFGGDNVLTFDLSDYSADRAGHVGKILRFIGANPERLTAIDENLRANSASEVKHIPNAMLEKFIYSELYQNALKALFTQKFRDRVKRFILPPPKLAETVVSDEDERYMLEQLSNGSVNDESFRKEG